MDDFLGTILKIMGFLIVFGSVLFLVVITTKMIGTRAKYAMRGRFINVIETINLGLDKNLYLVKLANDYILLASSGKKIEYLTKVNLDESLDQEKLDEEDSGNKTDIFNFKSIFEKYLGKNGGRKNISLVAESRNNFQRNLAKMKRIMTRIDTNEKINGDEKNEE